MTNRAERMCRQPARAPSREGGAAQADSCDRPSALWLAHLSLSALAIVPIVRHPLPPIADHLNHLARMRIIASGDKDPDLARYFAIDWQIIPNLAQDLIVPPLSRLVGLYAAGQAFNAFCLLAIISGMLALNRALFQRASLAPLVALPFLYNHMLLVGTVNYLLGIGVALWAIAAWVWLDARGAIVRVVSASMFVLVLFFCHLFALGLFGLGMLAVELRRVIDASRGSWRQRLAWFFAAGLVFVPVAGLMIGSPTSNLAASTYWQATGKLAGVHHALVAYSDGIAALIVAVIAMGGVLLSRRGGLRIHKVGWLIIVLGAGVFVAMPRVLFDSQMADLRLPVGLIFMLAATIDIRLSRPSLVLALAGALGVLLAIRVIEVDQEWGRGGAELADVRASTTVIARGARVLTVAADSDTPLFQLEHYPLLHAGALATIERSALTTRLFAQSGKQVLRVRAPWRERVDQLDGGLPTLTQLMAYTAQPNRPGEYIYWQLWPDRFDYLYVVLAGRNDANPDPARLVLLHRGERFHLYRIVGRGRAF